MKTYITRNAVLEYLKDRPGSRNHDIAANFNLPAQKMATKMKQFFDGGFVTREAVAKTITGVAVYGYSVTPGVTGKPKKERLKIAKTTVSIAPPAPMTLDALVSSLARAISEQVLAQVQLNLAQSVHAMLPAPAPTVDYVPVKQVLAEPAPAAAEATVLPKIGVVGLLPTQAGVIAEKFGSALDISFWSADDPFSKLDAISKTCEAVFIHVRHISHTTDHYLKGCKANVIRVTGGTSNMVDRIRTYFSS